MANNAPKKRSTILVAVGAGVFVVGTGLATVATRGGDDGRNAANVSELPTTTVVAAGSVSPPSGIGQAFVIPEGKQALEVNVPAVQGVAGYIKAADFVNVYGQYATMPHDKTPQDSLSKLLLQKVEVLTVVASPDGSTVTYVLAVDTVQAEAYTWAATFHKVWLTLARDDQGVLAPKGFSDENV